LNPWWHGGFAVSSAPPFFQETRMQSIEKEKTMQPIFTRQERELSKQTPTQQKGLVRPAVSWRYLLVLVVGVFLGATLAPSAYGQSDRGNLVGTVTDPTGAVIPKARVTVTNLETGEVVVIDTTSAGDFSAANLSAGKYSLEVQAAGFSSFVQKGITLSVAQTTRQNVKLAVGAQTDVIAVTEDATLLKTENAEQSTTISRKELNDLPIPFVQTQAIRDPMAFVKLTPGSYVQPGSNTYIRVNGLPAGSFHISVDGMDATNPNINDREDGNHPSVDNVQEFTVQSSNFAAEFGQVGGGLFNFTARSGTNQYHGAAYDYFTNEDLNAGRPFTQLVANGPIASIRQKTRQNDFGFTIGGPVRIPHFYNGHDKTFFFFSLEKFILHQTSTQSMTVPTDFMRKGDFHEILTGVQLGTDPLGRPIYQNEIYNPATARCATPGFTIAACPGSQVVADPYANNVITTPLDPVAAKIQALIPTQAPGYQCPSTGLCINNLTVSVPNPILQTIPAFKIDQVITQKWKVAFSYSDMLISSSSSNDGLPAPVSQIRANFGHADVYRFNNDYTLTPNLLLHAGAGYTRQFQNDGSPPADADYNSTTGVGLQNLQGLGFPHLGGLNSTYGGILNGSGNGLGPTARNVYETDKANGIASAVWTHGSHVIKGGVDFKLDMWDVTTRAGNNNVAGNFSFSNCETTALYNNCGSYSPSASVSGNTGFPYASFLLGQVDGGSIGNANTNQYHRPTYALYLQDTWHIVPKLSLDYGVRWDFTETEHEHLYRTSGFNPGVLNPGALFNGAALPGALKFEGFGHSGDCECYFMPHYPYAIGPRLGLAYQADPKTVFRAGFGITYGQAASFNYAGSNFTVVSVGINTLTLAKPTVPGLGANVTPVTTLAVGPVYSESLITDASRNPAYNCCTAINAAPSPEFDHNGGKPPRIYNFTVSMQKEITTNFVVEISYVGNRAGWLTSGASGAPGIIQPNALSASRVAALGFDVTNIVDAGYLQAKVSSLPAAALARLPVGFPYAGFPTNQTLAQALRPYAQYSTIYTEYSPSAKSWYDSAQIKVTKRMSHGLQFLNSFTWSKEEDLGTDTGRGNGAVINDALNRNSNKFLTSSYQPFVNVTSFTYELPLSYGHDALWKREVLKGWQLGGIFRYASGALLAIPTSGTQTTTSNSQPYVLTSPSANLSSILLRGTYAQRNPGVPLFTKNPNCHCFNPLTVNNSTTAGILNPAAFSEPALGHFGTTAVYQNDYRWQRQPDEELNLGKRFTFAMSHQKEGSLQIRAEFFNIFNRLLLPVPATNGYFTRGVGNSGNTGTGAFGNFNPVNNLPSNAYRTGQLVARFEF
jgi:hypothetical protein